MPGITVSSATSGNSAVIALSTEEKFRPLLVLFGYRNLGDLSVPNAAQQLRVLNHEVGAVRMQDSEFGKSLQADGDGLPGYARHMREIGMRE